MADSRPLPGPCTRTCTRFTPRFNASRAACSAATVAANGVDFLEPLNPALPDEPQVIAFPCRSQIVMSVLLNVAVMCATPSASTIFLLFLAPPAARAGAGLASGFAAGLASGVASGFASAMGLYFFSTGFFLPPMARRGALFVRALQ